jgi:hypothetical protein
LKYQLYWRSRRNAKAYGEGLRVGSEEDAKRISEIANKTFKWFEHWYEPIEKEEKQTKTQAK